MCKFSMCILRTIGLLNSLLFSVRFRFVSIIAWSGEKIRYFCSVSPFFQNWFVSWKIISSFVDFMRCVRASVRACMNLSVIFLSLFESVPPSLVHSRVAIVKVFHRNSKWCWWWRCSYYFGGYCCHCKNSVFYDQVCSRSLLFFFFFFVSLSNLLMLFLFLFLGNFLVVVAVVSADVYFSLSTSPKENLIWHIRPFFFGRTHTLTLTQIYRNRHHYAHSYTQTHNPKKRVKTRAHNF